MTTVAHPTPPGGLSAAAFVDRLTELASPEEQVKLRRYFRTGRGQYAEGKRFLGVRMRDLFDLAKEFIDLPIEQIEVLLESDIHEVRAGACSIMGKSASAKRTPPERQEALYELVLRRHDRINDWDLVDLVAPYVVGTYLMDRPRDVLDELARSDDPWRRRTSIIATLTLLRRGELDDAMRVAEILVHDDHDLVRKAVGGVLREVGKRDADLLRDFLDRHAATMPRVALRYAIERMAPTEREYWRSQRAP